MEDLPKSIVTGNSAPRIRSDCKITFELTSKEGILIDLHSKVGSMYGASIRELLMGELEFFGIRNAKIVIEDSGALPFVISARLEVAIKSLIRTEKEFLPVMLDENLYQSSRNRFRFSRLYLPGNTPNLMLNAGIHQPNGVILDLEDSVAPDKKEEARYLVRNALRQVDFMGVERMVRINQLPAGLDDLKFVIPHNIHILLVPKCEGPEQIGELEDEINKLEPGREVFLMPIIESALGVEKAFDIAVSSRNIVAMAIGLEDYTADIGVRRTHQGTESLYARTRLVNACKAAGIQPIDSVFSDVGDQEGLRKAVMNSKSLGFEGMGCIHPRQIRIIHKGYSPSDEEIENARKIVYAYKKATEQGLGVVSLGTKMIDPPVVKRAQKIIELAVDMNILRENWLEELMETK